MPVGYDPHMFWGVVFTRAGSAAPAVFCRSVGMLLLSGGVDSSVALQQLVAAGHKCRAFYLRIWLEEEQTHAARGDCPWEEDWAYCTAVCEQLGVPLEAVSLQNEYAARAIRRNSAQFCAIL